METIRARTCLAVTKYGSNLSSGWVSSRCFGFCVLGSLIPAAIPIPANPNRPTMTKVGTHWEVEWGLHLRGVNTFKFWISISDMTMTKSRRRKNGCGMNHFGALAVVSCFGRSFVAEGHVYRCRFTYMWAPTTLIAVTCYRGVDGARGDPVTSP